MLTLVSSMNVKNSAKTIHTCRDESWQIMLALGRGGSRPLIYTLLADVPPHRRWCQFSVAQTDQRNLSVLHSHVLHRADVSNRTEC